MSQMRGLRAVAALVAVLGAQGQGAGGRLSVNESPAQLVSWLSSAVQLESRLGALAYEHGATPEVRRYGQLLTGDARVEAEHLNSLAHSRGIPLREPEPLAPEVQERLLELQGTAFDQQVVALSRGLDGRILAALTQLTPAVRDGGARGAIRGLEPLFDQHLRLAVSLQRKGR